MIFPEDSAAPLYEPFPPIPAPVPIPKNDTTGELAGVGTLAVRLNAVILTYPLPPFAAGFAEAKHFQQSARGLSFLE